MVEGPVADIRAWRQVGAPFSAAFEAFCPTCGGHIEPGQQIRRFDYGDERTTYVHGRCSAPPTEA